MDDKISGVAQHVGGTTSKIDEYVGPERSIAVDTDKKQLVLQDGVTPGGHKVPVMNDIVPKENILQRIPLEFDLSDLNKYDANTMYPVYFIPVDGKLSYTEIELYRRYAWDARNPSPFSDNSSTSHIAGLNLNIKASDSPWGGAGSHSLKVDIYKSRYMNTVQFIDYRIKGYGMPKGSTELDPNMIGEKFNDYSRRHSGFYLRGGLKYVGWVKTPGTIPTLIEKPTMIMSHSAIPRDIWITPIPYKPENNIKQVDNIIGSSDIDNERVLSNMPSKAEYMAERKQNQNIYAGSGQIGEKLNNGSTFDRFITTWNFGNSFFFHTTSWPSGRPLKNALAFPLHGSYFRDREYLPKFNCGGDIITLRDLGNGVNCDLPGGTTQRNDATFNENTSGIPFKNIELPIYENDASNISKTYKQGDMFILNDLDTEIVRNGQFHKGIEGWAGDIAETMEYDSLNKRLKVFITHWDGGRAHATTNVSLVEGVRYRLEVDMEPFSTNGSRTDVGYYVRTYDNRSVGIDSLSMGKDDNGKYRADFTSTINGIARIVIIYNLNTYRDAVNGEGFYLNSASIKQIEPSLVIAKVDVNEGLDLTYLKAFEDLPIETNCKSLSKDYAKDSNIILNDTTTELLEKPAMFIESGGNLSVNDDGTYKYSRKLKEEGGCNYNAWYFRIGDSGTPGHKQVLPIGMRIQIIIEFKDHVGVDRLNIGAYGYSGGGSRNIVNNKMVYILTVTGGSYYNRIFLSDLGYGQEVNISKISMKQVGSVEIVADKDYAKGESLGLFTKEGVRYNRTPLPTFRTKGILGNNISSRDFVGIETWHEPVSDTDVVYPYGNVQYYYNNTDGIGGIGIQEFDGNDTYSLFGSWQEPGAIIGKGYRWSTMSDADRKRFIGNRDNNMYIDGTTVMQVRYRIRVIKGLRNDWGATETTETRSLITSAGTRLMNQGPCRGVMYGHDLYDTLGSWVQGSLEYRFNTGRNKGSYGTSTGGFSKSNLYTFTPIAMVQRRNGGIYDPIYNPDGCARAYHDGMPKDYTELPEGVITSTIDCFDPKKIATVAFNIVDVMKDVCGGDPVVAYQKYEIENTNASTLDMLLSGGDNAESYMVTGTIISTLSGRPDGLFVDEINIRDVEDKRMNGRKVDDVTTYLDSKMKDVMAGKIKGTELNNKKATAILRDEPVLTLGASGEFDNEHIFKLHVIKDDNVYKMWYTGHISSHWRIGYATSTDGITWEKQGMALDLGANGEFDDYHVESPYAIKDGNGYKMWYNGYDGSHWRIGYATSTDGITWEKQGMILDLGNNGEFDDNHISQPHVIKDDNVYKMWYTGQDGGHDRIGYATSTDGITWEKQGVALDIGGNYDGINVQYANVIKENGSYKMWYSGYDGRWRVSYATSIDGITWEKQGIIIDYHMFNDEYLDHAHGPSVMNDNGVYKMWYSGYNGGHWKVYYAEVFPNDNAHNNKIVDHSKRDDLVQMVEDNYASRSVGSIDVCDIYGKPENYPEKWSKHGLPGRPITHYINTGLEVNQDVDSLPRVYHNANAMLPLSRMINRLNKVIINGVSIPLYTTGSYGTDLYHISHPSGSKLGSISAYFMDNYLTIPVGGGDYYRLPDLKGNGEDVIEVYYTAYTNVLKNTNVRDKEPLSIGNVNISNYNLPTYGGKVSNDLSGRLNTWLITTELGQVTGKTGHHDFQTNNHNQLRHPAPDMNVNCRINGSVPATKFLGYVWNNSGRAQLNIAYKEIKWSSDVDNPNVLATTSFIDNGRNIKDAEYVFTNADNILDPDGDDDANLYDSSATGIKKYIDIKVDDLHHHGFDIFIKPFKGYDEEKIEISESDIVYVSGLKRRYMVPTSSRAFYQIILRHKGGYEDGSDNEVLYIEQVSIVTANANTPTTYRDNVSGDDNIMNMINNSDVIRDSNKKPIRLGHKTMALDRFLD